MLVQLVVLSPFTPTELSLSQSVPHPCVDDLLGKIRRLLLDPDQAETIRRAGRARALREHTWEMRFDRVFRMLGALT